MKKYKLSQKSLRKFERILIKELGDTFTRKDMLDLIYSMKVSVREKIEYAAYASFLLEHMNDIGRNETSIYQ